MTSSYPAIRAALAADYADLPASEIEALVESLYDDISAEDLEGFLSGLGRGLRAVGKAAKRALPGVVGGATTGAALGPWGAVGGALVGGALSLASKQGGRRGRRRRRPPTGAGARRRVPRRRRVGRVWARRRPAAASLVRALGRPEVGRALSSMALGRAGRASIPIGGTSVPTAAIGNMLSLLTDQVEAEMAELYAGGTGIPHYLLDQDGEYLVDPTDAMARAELVLELLNDAEQQEAADDYEQAMSDMEDYEDELDDMYDAVYEYESEDEYELEAWQDDDAFHEDLLDCEEAYLGIEGG